MSAVNRVLSLVQEKERSNRCDYFQPNGTQGAGADDPAEALRKPRSFI